MVKAIPDILARIVDHKRAELAESKPRRDQVERAAHDRRDFRDFRTALVAHPPAIIAEIKKASPSKGVLAHDFHPETIARSYAAGGAAALSVLTDREFFLGGMGDLQIAREAVAIPALRKDFTIDEFHVLEAAAYGADAILLIAAILDVEEMRRFRELAAQFKLAALVEVHDESELDQAVASGAEMIGVNNRNLHTFEVKLETSLRLLEKIPASVVKVAESGIESSADVHHLAGFDAFLVGEHLMKSPDPSSALRALRS